MPPAEDMTQGEVAGRVEKLKEGKGKILHEFRKAIIGQDVVVGELLMAFFAGGHLLITGVPGLAKTLMIQTMGKILDLSFRRIQFTPDLMPSDITGTEILEEDRTTGRRHMKFMQGPLFANIILADEINRASPKTQAALLEAMQEVQVTVSGVTYPLRRPFFVLATQNPIEQEGTYPLPEAQLDRFLFKLNVGYSNRQELVEILRRTTEATQIEVHKVIDGPALLAFRQFVRQALIAPPVQDYAVRLVLATIPGGEFAGEVTNKYVRYGASPRGAQAIVLGSKIRGLLDARYHASFEDVMAIAKPALRHRIILNFEAEAEGVTTDKVVEELLKTVPKQVDEA